MHTCMTQSQHNSLQALRLHLHVFRNHLANQTLINTRIEVHVHNDCIHSGFRAAANYSACNIGLRIPPPPPLPHFPSAHTKYNHPKGLRAAPDLQCGKIWLLHIKKLLAHVCTDSPHSTQGRRTCATSPCIQDKICLIWTALTNYGRGHHFSGHSLLPFYFLCIPDSPFTLNPLLSTHLLSLTLH